MQAGQTQETCRQRTKSPHAEENSCSGNPLIMPSHSNPIEPEKVVAVSAEEGKGAVPGEVDGGGGAQVGSGGWAKGGAKVDGPVLRGVPERGCPRFRVKGAFRGWRHAGQRESTGRKRAGFDFSRACPNGGALG